MTYKNIAEKILKNNKKPLHSKKITQIAIKKGWLKSQGLTPESTMNAQLIRDVNANKTQSKFIKTAPSTFGLNKNFKESKVRYSKEIKKMDEEFVKDSIIMWLSSKGFGRNLKFSRLYEKGVDIKVKNNKSHQYFLIETKGQGKTNQINYSYFLNSLGQIITRMSVKKTTVYKYGLGLPYTIAKIALRRIPWQVAKNLNLYILSVNESRNVTEYSWKQLKNQKSNLKQ